MSDVLASYNRVSYLALSKEMLRLCEGIPLEIKRMIYCLSFLMLVTLTRNTQVDQSKGLWCFDTSPLGLHHWF